MCARDFASTVLHVLPLVCLALPSLFPDFSSGLDGVVVFSFPWPSGPSHFEIIVSANCGVLLSPNSIIKPSHPFYNYFLNNTKCLSYFWFSFFILFLYTPNYANTQACKNNWRFLQHGTIWPVLKFSFCILDISICESNYSKHSYLYGIQLFK